MLPTPEEYQEILDKIVWTTCPDIFKEEHERNKDVTRMLCQIGTILEWSGSRNADGGGGYYLPGKFEIEGVQVCFIPNWKYILVGGMSLRILTTEEDIRSAARAMAFINLHKFGKAGQ